MFIFINSIANMGYNRLYCNMVPPKGKRNIGNMDNNLMLRFIY